MLLALPSLGISGLEFRIAEWSFHALDGVALTLEEDGAYLYEDVIGKPFERPPFVSLPTGGVASLLILLLFHLPSVTLFKVCFLGRMWRLMCATTRLISFKTVE